MSIIKAAVISTALLNNHVIDVLHCERGFSSIPTVLVLEANGMISKDTISKGPASTYIKIDGDWKLGGFPVKMLILREEDLFHHNAFPDLFHESPGMAPYPRYELILETKQNEVEDWYNKVIGKPKEHYLFIYDVTDRWKDDFPDAENLTSLNCTPDRTHDY